MSYYNIHYSRYFFTQRWRATPLMAPMAHLTSVRQIKHQLRNYGAALGWFVYQDKSYKKMPLRLGKGFETSCRSAKKRSPFAHRRNYDTPFTTDRGSAPRYCVNEREQDSRTPGLPLSTGKMNSHRVNVIRSVRCEFWKTFLCGTFVTLIYVPIRTVHWLLQNGLGSYFTPKMF